MEKQNIATQIHTQKNMKFQVKN